MKSVIVDLINNNELSNNEKTAIITRLHTNEESFQTKSYSHDFTIEHKNEQSTFQESFQESVEIRNLSLEEREKELIQKALKKHNGRRKNAAKRIRNFRKNALQKN